MAESTSLGNRVKRHRHQRGWSQDELARRAGISRAAVSAIEIGRVVPSVVVALSLANVLDCPVESLFGPPASTTEELAWAWTPSVHPCRYWLADVGGRLLRYPVESTSAGVVAHDGLSRQGQNPLPIDLDPPKTLVVASCDPAAGLLASEYARSSGFRMLVLPRGSRQALALLGQRVVHVAGLHFATERQPQANARLVKESLGEGFQLLRAAVWQEGLSVASGTRVHSVQEAIHGRLRWVGREAGSAARLCQDELLSDRPAPRRTASDHRATAIAIRSGWAEVGVCHRLACEEAGLEFHLVREEFFDLCYARDQEADPRLAALVRLVRSANYRKLLGELPGYATAQAGDLLTVV